jgi:Ca-activated chloride channel family protein
MDTYAVSPIRGNARRRPSLHLALLPLLLGACLHQVKSKPLGVVQARDPNAIALSGALGNRYVHAAAPGEVIARLRIDVRALESRARPPVNLALVLDTSGSMEGKPIADARAAAQALLDALAPGDRLAVVTFDSRTQVLVPSTRLDAAAIAAVRLRLAAIEARGTTDLAGGLSAGYQEVSSHLLRDGVNRIVLVSDGVPNNAAPILPLADSAGRQGISITSLGLGLDYDETLMGAIAQRSGGHFHFIKKSEEVASVFHDEVLRLRRVAARNMMIAVVPGPGVTLRSVAGMPGAQVNAGGAVAPLGDLGEGEQRDLIVRMTAPGRREGATVELIDATLTFDDAVAGAGRLERHLFLGARATASDAELKAGVDPDVERAAARVIAAQGVLEAIALARRGALGPASQRLDQVEREAKATAAARPDPELDRQVAEIAPLRAALPSLVAPPSPAPARPVEQATAPVPCAAPEETVRSAHEEAIDRVMGRGGRWFL